ncbi:MAG: hypothetical protein AAGJ81_10125 [Verrucomicrobiota bacterium]
MEWLIAYFALGLLVCVWSYRVAKKNGVKGPGGPSVNVPADPEGIVFLAIAMVAIWPILLPLWVWLEIGAKRVREKEKERRLQEEEMKQKNPYHGLSMDEQIDRLRDIHSQLEKKP